MIANTKPIAPLQPVLVGTGLVALDWLLIGNDRVRPNESYAGGSCGNVLAILAYLGWESYPVVRLGRDRQAQRVLSDFKRWNVRTDFVFCEEKGVTPVIIIRLRDANGKTTSRFEWRHPSSGEWLPRYRPLPKKIVTEKLSNQLPIATVFYFDRAEPSSLLLARLKRSQGAIVFFEPSSCRDDDLFSACIAESDIVKYSSERVSKPPRNPISKSPRLEVQTLGDQGLRYRLKVNSTTPGTWQSLPSFHVENVRDTTGCGDWCSAGIIKALCVNGRNTFLDLNEAEIQEGLRLGQALAAINCQFDGARGPMYNQHAETTIAAAEEIIQDQVQSNRH